MPKELRYDMVENKAEKNLSIFYLQRRYGKQWKEIILIFVVETIEIYLISFCCVFLLKKVWIHEGVVFWMTMLCNMLFL